MNTASNREKWVGRIKVYWPPWFILLIEPIALPFMAIAIHYSSPPGILGDIPLYFLVNAHFLIWAWLVCFPWIGWLSLAAWAVLNIALDYSPRVVLIFTILVVLQKGYLRFWATDWLATMRSTAFIDTRLCRYDRLLTRWHPAILGAKFMRRLGVHPAIWWIGVLALFFLIIRLPCTLLC